MTLENKLYQFIENFDHYAIVDAIADGEIEEGYIPADDDAIKFLQGIVDDDEDAEYVKQASELLEEIKASKEGNTTMTNTKKNARKYYAAWHNYGINVANDVTIIYRFDSKQARDEFVDAETFDGNGYHIESVTRNQARRYIPQAFKLDEYRDGYSILDERDWHECDEGEFFDINFDPYC